MATEPKIFTKNYVNGDDTFVVSSGSGAIANIYDRDKDSQWISSGANSDVTDVTIDITFYEGTTATNRTIDSFLLINHNIKSMDLYYWDGSAFQLWQTFTGLAASTTFQSISSQNTAKARVVFHTTQTANREKAVGELVLMALQLDIGMDLMGYTVNFRQQTKDVLLGDGTMSRAYIRWSYNRIEKYECQWSIKLVSDSLKASLFAIKQSGTPFLWYPESITHPDEIWYVHWYDARSYQYTAYVKPAGNDISAMFKEV